MSLCHAHNHDKLKLIKVDYRWDFILSIHHYDSWESMCNSTTNKLKILFLYMYHLIIIDIFIFYLSLFTRKDVWLMYKYKYFIFLTFRADLIVYWVLDDFKVSIKILNAWERVLDRKALTYKH